MERAPGMLIIANYTTNAGMQRGPRFEWRNPPFTAIGLFQVFLGEDGRGRPE